ncbi:MAG: ribonuclease G [Dehalococcoidia bacterium]|nr:ribonuclease G [Dehalococcoidia bacterium]
MGGQAVVPKELGEWNWGGFLLTWIWGIGNNVWWSFLVFVPYLGFMVMPWVLAFKGNQWAWQSKRWDSIEHFKRVQHTWTMWGLGITIAVTVLIILILLLGLGLFVWGVQQYGV